MDTLSHALWGYGLFGHTKQGRKRFVKTALFFGAMPDLISFGVFLVQRLLKGNWQPGAPPLATIPDWLYFNYSLGHSFVVSFAVILLVAIKYRQLAFAMLAWPFHIVLDFPFHSFAYFPTPMFWPLSDYKIDGIPWSNWYIWWPNVILLVLLLTYRHKQNRKNSL
jgi:hypothetical protein